jgi:choline dehydrogenase-like flavoprotein
MGDEMKQTQDQIQLLKNLSKPAIHRGHGRRVSALVYALADERSRNRELSASFISVNAITHFVIEQQSRMPDFLRFPIRLATWLLTVHAFLNHAGRWHRLSIAQRQSQIAIWRTSRIGPFRDFVKLYESLVTLAFESLAANQPAPVEMQSGELNTGKVACYPHPAVISNSSDRIRTDVAVIGSGPGGSITATLLAEAGKNVTLIEEGRHYDLNSCVPFSAQEMIQKYRCGGLTPAMGKPKVAYVEGRCVGGGSEINSGLYHRTPPEVMERWRREFKVDRFEESDFISLFEANERDLTVAQIPGKTPASSRKLHDGATAIGWKSMEIPRWFAFDGKTDSEGVPTGHRQSMTKTFIPRFLAAGGQLQSETAVRRFKRLPNGHWEIKSTDTQGRSLVIEAPTIFVACGATQTPALLQRSGVGHKPGSSLFMHPTVKFTTRFKDTINNEIPAVGVHQVKQFSPRLSFGCSIGSKPYLGLGLLDGSMDGRYLDEHWRQMSIYYAMITGTGSGSVRSLPGFRDPLVKYALSQQDLADLSDGLRKLALMLFESGAVELVPGIAGAPALKNPGDLSQIPAMLSNTKTNLMTIHLFGSCPMGEDKSRCVANSFGAVHDVPGLYLADASLLCTAPGVNPQGSIMAVVRRNAIEWLESHG